MYRYEKINTGEVLKRLNDEVLAACNFPSWNPKHFLDVGEMSLAIALAIDWTAGDLPKSTITLAKKSLIEKGIKTSWPENGSTPEEVKNFSRLAGAGLVWTAQFSEKVTTSLPTAWKGGGANPVVIFTGGDKNSNGFYFGGKGGRGTVNHGNMDGGSFIFELNGVRWSIDPGNQSYGLLERAGFNLWGRCQDCDRWKLLTKNNFGHSTISVNNQLHEVDGKAEIIDFKDGVQPEATFDLSPAFAGQLKSAQRRFVKENSASLIIEDKIEISAETKWITWQMLTQADIQIVKGGAVLRQDGQTLKLEILSNPGLPVSIISLDPPPLSLDKTIENLKRIEIRIPAWTVENGKMNLKVRLSGD